MSEESKTADPVQLTRLAVEAGSRRDWSAAASFYAPDAVWDMSAIGVGKFEGTRAIRSFWEDWVSAYEGFAAETGEILHFGDGVVLVVVRMQGRMTGAGGPVEQHTAWIYEWAEGTVLRVTIYLDIDEARAAAERLTKERADG